MAGRFPLYTDADVHGPYVDGLVLNGWNVLRAIDAYAEKTPDLPHFERAVREGRVLVSNDLDHLAIAHEWLKGSGVVSKALSPGPSLTSAR